MNVFDDDEIHVPKISEESDDVRTKKLAAEWIGKTRGVTGEAIQNLITLLDKFQQDGEIDDNEAWALQIWKSKYSHVAKRDPLKPFTEWLDQALADGVLDAQERTELMEWCSWVGLVTSERTPTKQPTPSRHRSGSWRKDPMSQRQFDYLLDLGCKKREIANFTKGEASELIDRLIEERDYQEIKSRRSRLRDRLHKEEANEDDHDDIVTPVKHHPIYKPKPFIPGPRPQPGSDTGGRRHATLEEYEAAVGGYNLIWVWWIGGVVFIVLAILMVLK